MSIALFVNQILIKPSSRSFLLQPLLFYPSFRSFTSSQTFSAPKSKPKHRAPKMPPPPKKMHHLKSINAIPSQYPEFRNVLWTGESSQLVVMTVPVGGEIGEEVGHRFEQIPFRPVLIECCSPPTAPTSSFHAPPPGRSAHLSPVPFFPSYRSPSFVSLIGPHRRPALDLHKGVVQSHSSRRGDGGQGWRYGHRSSGDEAQLSVTSKSPRPC